MAVFGGLILTDDGKSLYAKAQAGQELKITRIALGDETLDDDEEMTSLTSVKNEVLSCEISAIAIADETAKIVFVISNQELEEGFTWRELGVIAEDPDTGDEVLYCYGNAGDNGEYIASKESADVLEKRVSISLIVDNSINITATIDSSLVYATLADIEELQETVDTNTSNIETNATDISELKETVNTDTTSIATNTSDIAELQTNVATNTTNIEELQTKTDIQQATVELTETINPYYYCLLPIYFEAGSDNLELYFCGEKLIKGVHYIEFETSINDYERVSDICCNIKFLSQLEYVDMSDLDEFSDFTPILEIVVRGNYSDTDEAKAITLVREYLELTRSFL